MEQQGPAQAAPAPRPAHGEDVHPARLRPACARAQRGSGDLVTLLGDEPQLGVEGLAADEVVAPLLERHGKEIPVVLEGLHVHVVDRTLLARPERAHRQPLRPRRRVRLLAEVDLHREEVADEVVAALAQHAGQHLVVAAGGGVRPAGETGGELAAARLAPVEQPFVQAALAWVGDRVDEDALGVRLGMPEKDTAGDTSPGILDDAPVLCDLPLRALHAVANLRLVHAVSDGRAQGGEAWKVVDRRRAQIRAHRARPAESRDRESRAWAAGRAAPRAG